MREPTPEDVQTWATTPIATVMRPIVLEDGTPSFEEEWQRRVRGEKVVEILEGSPTKYHLRYESANALRLVGVEE